MDMDFEAVERRERDGVRRAAAAAAKSKFADSDKRFHVFFCQIMNLISINCL